MSAARLDGSGNLWWAQPGISTMALAEVADLIAEQTAKAAQAKGAVVWVWNPAQGAMQPLGAYGVRWDFVQHCPVAASPDDVRAGQPQAFPDLASCTSGIDLEAARVEGVAAMAGVPIINKGKVEGLLRVFHTKPRQFTDQDIALLQAMAAMAASALEHARVSQRCRTLFEVARTVSSTLSAPNAANLIAEHVAKALHIKGCSIRYLDRQRRTLALSGAYGLSAQYLAKGPIDADRSMAEAMAGHPVVVRDATTDPRVQYPDAAREEGVASMASIPMVLKGVVTGVLRVYTSAPYEFSAEDLDFLSALASISAAAIENAQLYDGIKSDFEALMDELVFMRRQGLLDHTVDYRVVKGKGPQSP